jgi:hypothetical protein
LKTVGIDVNDKAYMDYVETQSKKYDGKPEFNWDFYKVKNI